MPESGDLLQQIFQQHGLLGLLVGFLILGPGYTYFRTRNIKVQAESAAQALVNDFAKQERQRADRLEEQLAVNLQKLGTAEDEVSRLRLRFAETQGTLDHLPKLRRQVRRLMRRVKELEAVLECKQTEIDTLKLQLGQRQKGLATTSLVNSTALNSQQMEGGDVKP